MGYYLRSTDFSITVWTKINQNKIDHKRKNIPTKKIGNLNWNIILLFEKKKLSQDR